MKIAQVVSLGENVPPTSQSGLEFLVSSLTEELVKRGHDVTLFAPGESKTEAKLISLLPKELWKENDYVWNHIMRSIWNTAYVSSLAGSFDIIHCHTSTILPFMSFIKTPVVYTLHHRFENDLWRDFMSDPEKAEQMKFVLEQASKTNYVTISKKQQEHFLIAEKSYFKKHTSIPNGIQVNSFQFNEMPEDYLLYIGYINKAKGADMAVKIAKKLGKKLILAGNNYGEEVFFDEHIKPFLNDKIQYVGPVDFEAKNKLYKNAIATLAPLSWDEPFGLTIVEAQACGTPVIAFNKGAASELINNGITGFVVEMENEMADAVENVYHLKRKDCRAWVQEHFTVEKMTERYENYYKTLL